MSNLKCLVMCCLACIVPTVMMGIIVFIVVSLFFFLCKGLEYIYSKKGLVWKFVKSLWMRLISLIESIELIIAALIIILLANTMIQLSDLEFFGICCLACIVPTVMMGIIVFIIVSLFFFMCKGFEYIYSKKRFICEFVKSLWMRLINFIDSINFKIAASIIILLAGVVIQFLIDPSKLPKTNCVENLNNISIAVVTIQATLFTLVISLLALVSNNDKIYFGFEIKDFYFNHCTMFLKQKTMMYIGIVLILLNTFFLYFGLHDVIYAIFFISLWFIFESARNVMRIFAGTDDVYKERIEKYIDECLEMGKNVDTIYNNFARDWRKKIPNQDKSTDELYHRIYYKIYMYIIRN